MGFAAIAIVMLGATIGATFRLRFLLGMAVLILATALLFALSHDYGFLGTLSFIVTSQALLQAGYFAGLLCRIPFSPVQPMLTGLSAPEAQRVRRHDR